MTLQRRSGPTNPDPIILSVPCEQKQYSLSASFTVTPSVAGGLGSYWPTIEEGQTEERSIIINFEKNKSNPDIEAMQFVILNINIDSSAEGWSFYGKGAEFINAMGNCQYSVSSTVINSTWLQVKVSNIMSDATTFSVDPDTYGLNEVIKIEHGDPNQELSVNFRYVMSYQTEDMSEPEYYMSQDPGFSSRR